MSKADRTLHDQRPQASAPAVEAAYAQPLPIPGRPAYHMMVGVLKLLLPVTALSIFLLVLFWPQLQPDYSKFKVRVSELSLRQAESMTLIGAEFEGVDEKGQPYNITADQVSKSTSDANVIHLELPKGDISLNSGAWLALDAQEGRYDQVARTLDLFGDVTLVHDRGFEIKTETARVDLAAGTAQGSSLVQGQGPEGQLEAQGFEVLDEGERIIFTGRSRMVIYPPSEGGGT